MLDDALALFIAAEPRSLPFRSGVIRCFVM